MEKSSKISFYDRILMKASSPKAPLWMGLIFLSEIFLIIPLDAILLFFTSQHRNKIISYVLIATLGSLGSGLIGYFIGDFLWDWLEPYVIPNLISAALFNKLSCHFREYEHWTIFFGTLLPFPLKALSLSAGAFEIGALPFALHLLGGRLVRFTLIGISAFFWGDRVKVFLKKHFHWVVIGFFVKLTLVSFFLWLLADT
jgi:membrane protein YqaA with SNARE-associated domain